MGWAANRSRLERAIARTPWIRESRRFPTRESTPPKPDLRSTRITRECNRSSIDLDREAIVTERRGRPGRRSRAPRVAREADAPQVGWSVNCSRLEKAIAQTPRLRACWPWATRKTHPRAQRRRSSRSSIARDRNAHGSAPLRDRSQVPRRLRRAQRRVVRGQADEVSCRRAWPRRAPRRRGASSYPGGRRGARARSRRRRLRWRARRGVADSSNG